MQRVCFVLTSPFAVNGFLLNHFKVLADNFSITLVVNALEYPLSSDLDARVRVVHLDIARKIDLLSDLKSLFWLWRFFRRERFDLVHSLTPKAGLLGMLSAWLAGIRCRQHTFTGQVWVTRRGLSRYCLKQLDSLIAVCATSVLADSASQCAFLVAESVIKPGAIHVAGPGSISGVDTTRFAPNPMVRHMVRESLKIPDGALVFIALGRMTRDKGVIDLVESFKSLSSKFPRAWLLLAGPDEEDLASTLLEAAGASADRLRLEPKVVQSAAYLAAADVLVLPSYREGFGTVVLEAAAVGLPAIASRIYGLTDAVIEGVTGVCFPVGDRLALQAALELLIQNDVFRSNLGTQARQRALSEYSSDAISRAWVKQYSIVLSK
ncbi:glycosyltransferase [Dechloromonas sp.]|uniref:glycosyltransferase n=1 Tax=Dechloromonas sp. TaxID=1917218 RepID=UPI00286EB02C|nr:glycosyltransferase [Dechloromonas sp.]